LTCGYCSGYASGRKNKTTGDPDEPVIRQFCNKNRQADYGSSSCELFVLHPFFYCKRCNQQLDIKVCIARQNKKQEGCVKCSQGKTIESYQTAKEVFHEND